MRRLAAYRVVIVVLLLGVFYAFDWMPFRIALRDAVAHAVRLSGYTPISFYYRQSPAVSVQGRIHYYSRECTNIALYFVVTPFLYVFGAQLWRSAMRIVIAGVIVLGVNIGRCWVAVYFDVLNVDRFYSHDLIYHVGWWSTALTVVVFAIRRDSRNGQKAVQEILSQ